MVEKNDAQASLDINKNPERTRECNEKLRNLSMLCHTFIFIYKTHSHS